MSDNISNKEIDELIKKLCSGCGSREALEGLSRCFKCREYQLKYEEEKKKKRKLRANCHWILQDDTNCTYGIFKQDYCKRHTMYEGIIDPDEVDKLPKCSSCRNRFKCSDVDEDGNKYKTCDKCRERSEKNREVKRETSKKCLHCNLNIATDNGYCIKHWGIWWKVFIESSGFRVCPNYVRGCRSKISDDHEYNYCENCLQEERSNCNNINYYFRVYKKNAKNRGLLFDLTLKQFQEICINNCYYCGYQPNGSYNGVDRIDSNKNYTNENCISCCRICNIMKSDKRQEDFINICIHIAKANNLIDDNVQSYTHLFEFAKSVQYHVYRSGAIKRNYQFDLTNAQFENYKDGECYYCGSIPNILEKKYAGIDRKKNHIGYNISNCVSCCKTCNQMKNILSDSEYIEHIGKIVNHNYNVVKKTDIKIDDNLNQNIKNITNQEIIKKVLINKITNNDFKLEPSNEKFNHSVDYYREKLFVGTIDNIKYIDIELEVVETPDQKDLWNYYRANISSFRKDRYKSVGRSIKILVKDKTTNKYLGILSIGSDFMNLKARDDYIGWNNKNMKDLKFNKSLLQRIININTCVPNNLFGFNCCGGKLLAMLCFSKELIDIYYKKYNDVPLFITTLSLYGKSIQYDRLKELKLLGYTAGTGMPIIPDNIYNKGRELIDKNELKRLDSQTNSKQRVYGKILEILNLSKDYYLYNHIHRGIYGGYLFPESKNILLGMGQDISEEKINTLRDTKTIFNDWFNRYAKKRYMNLLRENKLLKTANFITSKKYIYNEKNKKFKEQKKKESDEYNIKQAEYMREYRAKNKNKQLGAEFDLFKNYNKVDQVEIDTSGYKSGTIIFTKPEEIKQDKQKEEQVITNTNKSSDSSIKKKSKEPLSTDKGKKISITKAKANNKKNIEIYKKILLQPFNSTNGVEIHKEFLKNNITNVSEDQIQYCRKNFKKFIMANIDKNLNEIFVLVKDFYGFEIPKTIINEIIQNYS
jgi:hypothetical protein